MKKIIVGIGLFAVCLGISMTAVNAWAMAFNGSNGYYKIEESRPAKFSQWTNKLRHMSGSAITIEHKLQQQTLFIWNGTRTVYPTFNTTTLNQKFEFQYDRTFSGTIRAEWTGWSGGTISADLYLTSR